VTSLSRPQAALRVRTGTTRRRLATLARTELRLLRRFGVLLATGVVTILWIAILLVLPPAARQAVVPFALLTDITALGFLFVPTLLVLERVEGAEAALRMTPARPSERLGVRVGLLTVLSLAAGSAVTVAAGVAAIPVVLLGLATTSVLTGVVASAAVGTSATLTTFLLRAPLIAGPLLTPALLHGLGLVRTPLLHLSPVTSAVDMLHGRMSWAGLAWQLTWITGAVALTLRSSRRPPQATAAAATGRRASPWPAHPGAYHRGAAMRSLARADQRTLMRDGLLIMLALSVPLVAVAARIAGTAGVSWARTAHGVDLAPYLPVVWALLLVLHTPLIFGTVTGLLLLEDRDAGILPAVATTRASVATLLGYRLAVAAAATAVTLAVGLVIAGVEHPAGVAGSCAVVVAAAAISVVPALLMAAFAGNRVQGVAVMKIISLPLYVPLASWFVDSAQRWLFAPLPSSWALWSLWSATLPAAMAMAAGAVVTSALAALVLTRRFLRQAI
jgi:fluoroquinolone transport system permease protein